jgi:hypothetical protein
MVKVNNLIKALHLRSGEINKELERKKGLRVD